MSGSVFHAVGAATRQHPTPHADQLPDQVINLGISMTSANTFQSSGGTSFSLITMD